MVNPKRQKELIEQLASICEELDWVVGIPIDAEKIPGLIMGEEKFVKDVVSTYYGDEYEVFGKDIADDKMKEVPKLPSGRKSDDPTFH